MSSKERIMRLLGIVIALSFMIALTSGCSDNSTTNPDDGDGGGGIDVTFSRYTQLVQEIAPPAYTGSGSLYKPYAPADCTAPHKSRPLCSYNV